MKFKVGDEVVIAKRSYLPDAHWNAKFMNRTVGQVGTVIGVTVKDGYHVKIIKEKLRRRGSES